MDSSSATARQLVDSSLPSAHSSADPARSPAHEPPVSFFVEALYPFNGESTSSLSFQKGDIIEVLTQLPSGWWDGVIWRQLERGWFPSNYVRRISDEDAQRCRAANEASKPSSDSSVLNIYPSDLSSAHSPRINDSAHVWDHQDLLNPRNSTPSRQTFDPNSLQSKSFISRQSSAFDTPTPQSSENLFSSSSNHSHLFSSTSSTRNQFPSSSTSWAGWLPKVTDDNQIYYHNPITGEISSEMPSANDDLEFELRPEPQTRPRKSLHASQSKPLSEFHSADPQKFLEDNGFSSDALWQHGILSSPPPSPTQLSTINYTAAKLPTLTSSGFNQSTSESLSAGISTSGNSTHLKTLSSSNSDLGLSLNPNHSAFHQTRESSPRSSSDLKRLTPSSSDLSHAQPLHSNRQSFEYLSSKPPRSSTSKQIFQVSQHVKDNLKPIIDVPPTLTFVRMVAEIKDSISLLTHLTDPPIEDSTLGSSCSSDPQYLRDQLSRASIDLVDKIRFLLQASCQLDTAVLSMLNECSFAANFNSLSIGPARPSSMYPISPYLSNRHSTSSSQSHISAFGHIFINAHLHLPGLKHVSRKIASTLSKLTLSTRALWGLLCVRSSEMAQPQDGFSPNQLDTPDFNKQQHCQGRYLLEQKLRSECRMGVSDLSSSIDAFFNHFEGILVEQSVTGSIDSAASTIAHFPRHGFGHLVMPVESIFLPSGPQGANWRASGYEALLSFSSNSDDIGPPGGPVSPRSKRRFSTPSVKLDSHYLTQKMMPLVRQIRESAESLNSLLLVDPVKQVPTDELIITSEPPNLKCIDRIGPDTSDLVLTQVSTLIESTGNLLATAENLDIASSLEVDFDQFIWFDLIHDTQSKSLMGFSGSSDPINQAYAQLESARRLVNNFQRSKQSVYDVIADLVHSTQMMLTSGGTFWSTPIPSPAQPISASPLFIVHQPWSSAPSPDRLFKTVHRLIISLESLSASTHALIQEASEQLNQETKLGTINQVIKNGLFQLTPIVSSSQGSSVVTRRMRSSSSGTTSQFRNHPPSPRHYHQSRGIEDEHAELERSAEGYMQDHTSEVNHPGNLNLHKREPSTLLYDVDRLESGSSKSPTRSKKVAKFFGEEAATQFMPPLKPTSSKPAFLLPDYGPDDISFNVENQIRGGTLRGLVIKLTSHEGPDVPFLRVFLMTYRTFTTSHAFLDLLIERYHQQPPPNLLADELQLWTDQKQKVIKIRVINVIRSWIESHLSDEDADSIIQRVTEFSAHDMGDTNLARQVALTCERRLSRGALNKLATPVNPPGNPPPPILPRNLRKIKFLDIDPLELARQLSLVESKLFCQIQVNECLGKAWPKEFAKEGTPNIKAMIDMSNALTRWVAETILMQPEQKKRASTIKHFILVADRCRSLNNFSTLMQIIAGLNSTPIYRLRRTWETIPQKILTLFAQLGSVMSPTKNYAAYRDTIRNMAPPCVPFVGVYLTDWTFIGDGNPDNLREKPHQINFNKRQKAAELIVQIQSYQSMPYQLTPLPVIVKFLEESLENPKNEKELYDLSLELEPRERDDEKIARLLAESGFL